MAREHRASTSGPRLGTFETRTGGTIDGPPGNARRTADSNPAAGSRRRCTCGRPGIPHDPSGAKT